MSIFLLSRIPKVSKPRSAGQHWPASTINQAGQLQSSGHASNSKLEIKSAALSIWQDNWDNGETGRSTHDIVPRVSNNPFGSNRQEIMFVTGHGPFPSYLHSSNT
ncbi:hypothetical protein AVEN_231848-1 [Araneus ventricosus]|uniref:Uncharacterized protein n=1 Tax=Araneus ventricosus TaxID=182803 RepID=A0A4Y2BQ57_ARAVE|nr:hypothetical protein AVEN_231848-1 [Araneus ventricosus]